jgi:hypothetical protein
MQTMVYLGYVPFKMCPLFSPLTLPTILLTSLAIKSCVSGVLPGMVSWPQENFACSYNGIFTTSCFTNLLVCLSPSLDYKHFFKGT